MSLRHPAENNVYVPTADDATKVIDGRGVTRDISQTPGRKHKGFDAHGLEFSSHGTVFEKDDEPLNRGIVSATPHESE
jgi:hypothetical protein